MHVVSCELRCKCISQCEIKVSCFFKSQHNTLSVLLNNLKAFEGSITVFDHIQYCLMIHTEGNYSHY